MCGRGLVGCDGISHHIPIAFSFPEILHATRVSTSTVLIQSLMHLHVLQVDDICNDVRESTLAVTMANAN